jgi:FkbM family methyltransferase
MHERGVTLLVDGGANTGQFATAMRASGWGGRIVSFEPLPDAFAALSELAANDPSWEVENVALGAAAGSASINIAGNSMSSSLLPMLDAHLEAAPDSAYTGSATVDVVCLDDALRGRIQLSDRVCVKLDCQGYEREILAGAGATMRQTVMMVVELSFVPLYEGGVLFDEAVSLLRQLGFSLVAIEPVFADPATQELLSVDGCFVARRGGAGIEAS